MRNDFSVLPSEFLGISIPALTEVSLSVPTSLILQPFCPITEIDFKYSGPGKPAAWTFRLE